MMLCYLSRQGDTASFSLADPGVQRYDLGSINSVWNDRRMTPGPGRPTLYRLADGRWLFHETEDETIREVRASEAARHFAATTEFGTPPFLAEDIEREAKPSVGETQRADFKPSTAEQLRLWLAGRAKIWDSPAAPIALSFGFGEPNPAWRDLVAAYRHLDRLGIPGAPPPPYQRLSERDSLAMLWRIANELNGGEPRPPWAKGAEAPTGKATAERTPTPRRSKHREESVKALIQACRESGVWGMTPGEIARRSEEIPLKSLYRILKSPSVKPEWDRYKRESAGKPPARPDEL